MTTISQEDAKRDLETTLQAIGAPPSLEIVSPSVHKWLIGRHSATFRTLAPAHPPLPPPMLRTLENKDYNYAMRAFVRDCLISSAWKLQRFGERWPLASNDHFQEREFKKRMHSNMRQVNSLDGYAACGKKKYDITWLLKCARCRITMYCGRKC